MLSRSSFSCPFCELVASIVSAGVQQQRAYAPSRQLVRQYAQIQKRGRDHRPSRMALSPSVAKPPPRTSRTGQKDRPTKLKEHKGPFGGMNRTFAPASIEAQTRRDRESRTNSKAHTPSTTLPPSSPVRRKGNKGEKPRRQPGDMKALKMQRALSHVNYNQRSSTKTRIQDVDSFQEFPLLPAIQQSIPSEALKGLVDISPTPIQRLAIPTLLGSKDGDDGLASKRGESMRQFLLAAETGSGKTLAYLLPTVDAVKRADLADVANGSANSKPVDTPSGQKGPFELEPPPLSNAPHPTAGRPRAIVLVPTAELVEQVGQVFKAFSHTVKLRVALISAAYTAAVIRNRLFKDSGIDIVISTPHLIQSITASDPNILSRVSHLVIDEADSLFDQSFTPITSAIVDRATPSLEQLVLCSATIPRSLDTYIQKRFPDIVRLATPNLHAIPRRVQLSIVDIDKAPYRGSRDLACADAIWQIGRSWTGSESDGSAPLDSKRLLVFVNEREKAVDLAAYLVTKGIDAVALNRDTKEQRAGEILAAFTAGSPLPVSKDKAFEQDINNRVHSQGQPSRILNNVKVLVMTDLGSRGIDTVAVRNVVLYDVPHTSVDFIHRLGRIGRMGRRGRGIVLVGKDDRKDVVREVREGMFRGQALI